jgi:hypothetical protein
MKTIITIIIAVHFSLLTAHISEAQDTVYVPQDYPSIQQGIDAAVDGNVVLVDTGIYEENLNFNGKAITVASHFIMDGDTNHINNTKIDGSQPAIPHNGSVVTFSSGEDSTSVICGFTITGGTGTYIASTGERYGGGIYCNYAGAKIIHNKITNNTIEHSNQACGGGIGCRFGSWIVIRDNTIRGNVVSSDNDALGAGIYSRYNSTIISDNIISHDSLFGNSTFGGGVCLSFTYNTLMTGNIITRNKVYHSYNYWNGVYFFRPIGPVNILQNEFSYNEGAYMGDGSCGGLGFWEAYDYPVLIDGNRFLHNSALYGGGLNGSISFNLHITNNVFVGNNAIEGGAIRLYQEGSSNEYRPRIINNTFINNSADGYGGAICVFGGDMGSTPVVTNCIFWENFAPLGHGEDIDNYCIDTVYVYYSDIEQDLITGEWLGDYNFLADPELDPDNIHLLKGSPCINGGVDVLEINGTSYFCPDHDIDGDPRPLNGAVDIGADESLYTGISEKTNDNLAIMIYPNPASDHFILTSQLGIDVISIEIINIQGKVVLHQKVTNNNLSFNINPFPNGLYFIRIHTNEGVGVKKLLIQ